ncbi:hypothetical protein G6F43_012313 [Rhizopus delemar]|nr:hypothetical protein G6F43_012313 [Rhizopus delemar]
MDDKRTLDLAGEGVIEELKAITVLKPILISISTSKLIDTIIKSLPSTIVLRKAIRTHIAANINLDIIENAQINFIESSPGNPLLLPQLERTAAVHTTIFLVNTLFLDINDIIGFKWFEVTAYMTSDTKWDGIGFSRKNNKVVTLIVELSGGLKHNYGNLYLESVMMLETGFFIRRIHVKIPIPNTVRLLQKLIYCTPQMLEWREAVARLTRNIDEACE